MESEERRSGEELANLEERGGSAAEIVEEVDGGGETSDDSAKYKKGCERHTVRRSEEDLLVEEILSGIVDVLAVVLPRRTNVLEDLLEKLGDEGRASSDE